MFYQNKNVGARLDQFSSDADFKTEALRLLPQVAMQQAEEIWRIMRKELKLDSSQRCSLVNDLMRPYKNQHSSESRALLSKIESALRKKPPFSPWLGIGRACNSKFSKRKS